MKLRKVRFHAEESVEKGQHIVSGSTLQQRENRKVAKGIRSNKHEKVIAIKITFSGRIPAGVCIGLGEPALTVTVRDAIFLAVADSFFPKEGGGPYRSTIAGKGKFSRVNEPILNGFMKELNPVQLKNKRKGMGRFQRMALKERKDPG
ncbi:hypothetical protein [Eisenbergiella sp.]